MTKLTEEQIAAALAKHGTFGIATAAKRGRNPKFPYVPIVDLRTGEMKQHGHTSQIMGKAYATREAAIARAQRGIDAGRAAFIGHLNDPRWRALRRQYGLPEEL